MGFDWWRNRTETPDQGPSVQEIVDRVQAEWRTERSRLEAGKTASASTAALWPHGWPHEAPDYEMGALEAHQTMQRHRECRTDHCPRKAAARQALIDAGRMRPDTGRQR